MNILLKWQALRDIRRLKIGIGLTFFLVLIPGLAAANTLLSNYGIDIDPPVNFLYLYVASLYFYIGNTLFNIFCPPIIVQHDNRFIFKDFCIMQVSREAEFLDSLEEKQQKLTNDPEAYSNQIDLESFVTKFILLQQRINSLDLFEKTWSTNNKEIWFVRLTIQTLYFIAFFILFYLTAIDAPTSVVTAFDYVPILTEVSDYLKQIFPVPQ